MQIIYHKVIVAGTRDWPVTFYAFQKEQNLRNYVAISFNRIRIKVDSGKAVRY